MAQRYEDSDALQKITDKHERSRQSIHSVTTKQWRVLDELKDSHARLIAWLNRNKQPKTLVPADHPTPPSRKPLEQLTLNQIAEMDTIIHSITPYHGTDSQPIVTAHPISIFPVSYHHPCIELIESRPSITGDPINVSKITQEQPTDQTTIYQDEMTPTQKTIIKRGQEEISKVYQDRFLAKHPGKAYFPDQECMPSLIKMGILNHFSIASLLHEGYFPETEVLVELDPSLGDRIICE